MFTGIIDHCGVITRILRASDSIHLSISHSFSDLVVGESICVDGVCLTITCLQDNYFDCDLSEETLKLTVAKNYCVGDLVNLERSLRLSDRMSGHIVTGHIDAVLKIKKFKKQNEFALCEFSDIQKQHALLLTLKGSVCIHGVSLTINAINHTLFSVMLIPHTLHKTNFHRFKKGDYVNVEYDYLAKIAQRNLRGIDAG